MADETEMKNMAINEPLLGSADGDAQAEVKEEKKPAGKTVLTRQQINQALMDIEDLHPLRERAEFDHIVPFLKCCRRFKCCKPEPNFNHGLRKSLLAEIGGLTEKQKKGEAPETVPKIKIPKSETALLKDPFLMLGYGINAYFEILMSLTWGMFIITLFISPMIYAYSNN